MYCNAHYMYMYINIRVPSMLAIGVETINKQTKFTATKGLENIKAALYILSLSLSLSLSP